MRQNASRCFRHSIFGLRRARAGRQVCARTPRPAARGAAFEAARPRILGALLDAIAVGLKRLPATRLPGLPRMADFALWASACEQAFWPDGAFWAAYSDNLDEVVEGDRDASLAQEGGRAA